MGRHRKRLALEPIEDVRLGAVEQAADRDAQFEHPRRDLAGAAALSSNIADNRPIVTTT